MITFTADKLKQARDSGYTDDEIWGFASQQDDRFAKAKEAGYSLDEVSGFFSEQQPQKPEESVTPVGTSIGAELAAIPQALKQAVDQPTEAMAETATVLGMPALGETLRGAVEGVDGYVPAAQRFMQPQEGEFQIGGFAPQFLPRAIVEQAGQVAGAIATSAAGRAIGGLVGLPLGPAGKVAGQVAGQFLGPALFEMSQIIGPVARERAANQGREEPNTDDLAWAWGTAGASGALNAIGAKYLPNGDKLVGGLANRISTAIAGEGTTEGLQSVVQQTGQTFLTEQGLEIKPKEALGEAIIGGGAGGGAVALAAPFTPTPEVKATVAADTKVAAEQAAPVAPETAQVVSEQANQVIAQAQAEETAETPDERVARLQREAQEAAGEIELEEDVSGLPPVEPTPPVTPTPEAAVAPVEPQPIVTEETPPPAPEPTIEAAAPPQPTVAGFTTAKGSTYEVTPEGKTIRTKRSEGRGQGETYEPHSVLFVPSETNYSILSDMQGGMGDYSIRMGYSEGNRFIQVTDTNQIPADVTPQIAIVSRSTQQIIPNGVYDAQRNPEVGFNPVEKLYKPDGTSSTHLGNQITEIRPIAEVAPAEVEPTPVAQPPVTPQLEPLRRVVKAEQTEEDVAGLVDSGFVEVYNGQPVLTQAGLDALPEAERPRLTPEARKIQIDTRTSEAAAEAISKNLRIGVDQVPVDVRMPAGWTLVGDVYVPPKPMERITEFKITPEYDVEETADVFAAVQKVVPPRQPDTEPEVAADQEIKTIQEKYQTSEPTAGLILNQKNFVANEAGVIPEGWVVERISDRNIALSPVWQKSRRDIQEALRKFTVLERAALSGRLFEEGWINEAASKQYIADVRRIGDFKQAEIESSIAAAETEANERFDDLVERVFKANRANVSDVAGEVSKPAVDLAAEEQARAARPVVSYGAALDPNVIEFKTARQALQMLADANIIATGDEDAEGNAAWRTDPRVQKPRYVLLQEAASILAKTNLRGLDAELIKIDSGGGRANRAYAGNIFIPRTRGPQGEPAYLEPWILLHEVGHTLTSDAFQKYVPDTGKVGADYYNQLKAAQKDKSVPREVKRAITLYIDTIKALGLEKEYFKKNGLASNDGDRAIRNAKIRTANKIINPFTGKQITTDDMYALGDMHEFYAQAWNSQSFQDILKQIKVTPQRSAFQKFVDIIKDVLGFESDTMAYAVIDTSLRLASLEAPTDTGATIESRIDFAKRMAKIKALPKTKADWLNYDRGKFSFGQKMARNKFTKLGYDYITFRVQKEGRDVWYIRAEISESWNSKKVGKTLLPSREVFAISFNNKATAQDIAQRLMSDVTGMVNEEYGKLRPMAPRTKPSPVVRRGKFSPSVPASQQQVQSAIDESRARREQNVEPENVEFEGEDKTYAIAPSETIGKSLRDVLRIVSETNLTNTDVFPPSEQTMQDVAAVLAQLDSPVLDSETVVSLESRGYGRDGNFSARRFPDGAIGVHDNEPQSVETYVHEASHSLTVDQIDKYLNWETSGSGKDYIDSINKAIADPATPEPVKRLFSLYTSTLDQLGLMEQFGGVDGVANWEADARYAKQKAQSRQRAGKIRKDLDNEQIYGLVDMREFVAQTFSSESFRDLLKTLKDPNAPQKSLWSAFVEAIQKILNLPQSSMAAAVIQASVDISTLGEVTPKRTGAGVAALGPEYQPEAIPTFTEGTPEAATLKEMEASMAKVDAASEAKGGKPETYKISEIASVWMDSGLGERELQDAIVEYTNLTPANAARVAKAIAKQYGLQQQIAETGAVIAEIAPEPEGAPRKSSVTKLIEQTTGVRKPVVKLQVSESAALKKQIQLKAREARETRKARKEAAEELAKAITDYVKANPIRGPINSRQAMSITKKALKLDVNNEAAVDRFEMYVERVIENANYDRDWADARALIKRAKAFAKSKDTQGNVKTTLEAIANVAPALLDNPFEFNLVVQRYLLGLAPVTAKQYAVMPDADVRRYLESLETQIKDNQEVLDRAKAQRILDKQAAYAEEKGIPLDEAIAILNSEEFLQEKTIEKLEDLTKLLTAMAQESQKDVKAYDDAGATPKQKELISFMRKVNLDSLINEEKKRYIRFANNLLANGATFGMEQFQSIALGQEAAMKAVKDRRLSDKLSAWISPIGGDKAIDTARRIALRTQSEADTFKNIFGREAVGAFRNILGLNRLDVAQTDSNRAKEQIANEFGEYFKGLRKKYGDDATGFEAKGYAGIAGYLIQTDGNKTEAESIPYRRRLMEQNIVELRKSDKQSDLAEADLKERALAQLTGATNAEILSQLKALNPASYEQLMWVKDVMLPKWRDFLKEHDENFRNQANNYNNPDHLTITYKFPEGQLLPSEMEDVYQQDMIGMRIKQAANSIKRKDHPNLPVSKTGTIANIDINFGYNQYNALVDQVDKAFVAPAWEQVVAFTKAPEFEQVMGGRANALFVKNLLRDIQTSRSRQSLTDDEAQLIAGGVRLARKISTQAVLGGITQPLRQVPDQLAKLFFTTGRFDLITKNLLTTAQAAPLLNKFPIGRRGDAQAGTQYASQFSELARKVEASVTDRKWAKYRELMNKVGEFWMTPLRGSDVWAAKVSWMSYYEAELNKKGIKMESWEREAELVDTDQDRKEAAAYAEFAVDFYGGASDPTKMAALSKQSNNGWKEFAKLVFLPLNSFALQQKNSLISDLRDAYLRTGDRKASIAAIAGTLAGMAAFHGMRIYIIGGLIYPAGKALLMGIFGIDMDEPDEEEKQKQLEDNWRKFKASMYGNIIAGGAGEFAEKAAIDAVNRTAYLWDANINPDSLLNDKGEIMSFRQYEKEVSPLYRFRSYGSSEYSFGLADVLTEQATHALAETQQLMTPEEMEKYTGNEQAYAAFATGVEWMYFFRLMDTDVKRIATDLKRQMDKEVKEREAELKRIREGR